MYLKYKLFCERYFLIIHMNVLSLQMMYIVYGSYSHRIICKLFVWKIGLANVFKFVFLLPRMASR